MTANPNRMNIIAVPDCELGEDVIFDEANEHWYLTCMKSNKVIVGEVDTDNIKQVVDTPVPYPHGLAVHTGIDRVLITNTVSYDLKDPGENLAVFEASTMKPLSTLKLSNKPSPSGEAPVEILFVPGAEPPVAYVTNMFGNTLWTATWNADRKDFDVAQAFDFNPLEMGVPLEMYFNDAADRLYVTTANPGHFHIFGHVHPGRPVRAPSAASRRGHRKLTSPYQTCLVQPAFSRGSAPVQRPQCKIAPEFQRSINDAFPEGQAMHRIIVLMLVTLSLALAGCQGMPKADQGALAGAAVGGAVGHNFGSGSGKVLATFGGAVLGALAGSHIGRRLDAYDEHQAQHALEHSRTGEPTTWVNPDRGHEVTMVPTETYQTSSGRYCREYQTQVEVGHEVEEAYGTACRQPDGSWEIQ